MGICVNNNNNKINITIKYENNKYYLDQFEFQEKIN